MVRTGRKNRKNEQLPLAEIRKAAFKKELENELENVSNTTSDGSISWIENNIDFQIRTLESKAKRKFPKKNFKDIFLKSTPIYSTYYRWFKSDKYPGPDFIKAAKYILPKSYEWLVPNTSKNSFHKVLDALDLFLISRSKFLNRPLFSEQDQECFFKEELKRIFFTWVYTDKSNTSNKKNIDIDIILGKVKRDLSKEIPDLLLPQSISNSLLHTHGASALPFHLLSLADYGLVNENNAVDWLCDLLISTILISSSINFYDFGERFDSQTINHADVKRIGFDPFGTAPSILKAVMACTLFPYPNPTQLKWYFEDGLLQGLHNIERISESLESGFVEFRSLCLSCNINWGEITNITSPYEFGSENGKGHLRPTVEQSRNEIFNQFDRINLSKKTDQFSHKNSDYLLTNRFNVPVIYNRNNKNIVSAQCNSFKRPRPIQFPV